MRYRYNERDVQTPTFDATEYVRLDAAPQTSNMAFRISSTPRATSSTPISPSAPAGWGTLRLGYGHEGVSATAAASATSARTSSGLTFDTFTSQYVTVRAASIRLAPR